MLQRLPGESRLRFLKSAFSLITSMLKAQDAQAATQDDDMDEDSEENDEESEEADVRLHATPQLKAIMSHKTHDTLSPRLQLR